MNERFHAAARHAAESYAQGKLVGHDRVLLWWVGSILEVGIAGTDDVSDWLSNLDVRRMDVSTGSVHAGVWQSAERIDREIGEELRDAGLVRLRGHSRGGALACALAWRIASTCDVPVDVVTFGAPRWCDQGMGVAWRAHGLHHVTAQVQNRLDLIPHLPWAKTGWRHVGETLQVGDRRTSTLVRAVREARRSGLASVLASAYTTLAEHHAIQCYVELVGGVSDVL